MIDIKAETRLMVEQIRYKLERFSVNHATPMHDLIDRMEISARREYVADYLIQQMSLMLAGKIMQQQTISWPATWWDHFKLEAMPQWIKRRCWGRSGGWRWLKPVLWKAETMVALDVHPELRPNPDDQRRGFIVIQKIEGLPPL